MGVAVVVVVFVIVLFNQSDVFNCEGDTVMKSFQNVIADSEMIIDAIIV